jgi:hypothetical protein
MQSLLFLFVTSLVFCSMPLRLIASRNDSGCAITKRPNPPFVPPAGYGKNPNTSTDFLYGTELLWTVVHQYTWHAGGNDGYKLPYFRRGYDMRTSDNLRLAVVARRLDALVPLVWAPFSATSGSVDPRAPRIMSIESMAMLSAIDIPTAGCWEISAHYADQSLTYTVRVDR